MIKAEYRGISDYPLMNGRIYPITTYCDGGLLYVRVAGKTLSYPTLERLLKFWKVRAVCRG